MSRQRPKKASTPKAPKAVEPDWKPLDAIIEKATADEDDEPYNDSIEAYEAEEEKIGKLKDVLRAFWRAMTDEQRSEMTRKLAP